MMVGSNCLVQPSGNFRFRTTSSCSPLGTDRPIRLSQQWHETEGKEGQGEICWLFHGWNASHCIQDILRCCFRCLLSERSNRNKKR